MVNKLIQWNYMLTKCSSKETKNIPNGWKIPLVPARKSKKNWKTMTPFKETNNLQVLVSMWWMHRRKLSSPDRPTHTKAPPKSKRPMQRMVKNRYPPGKESGRGRKRKMYQKMVNNAIPESGVRKSKGCETAAPSPRSVHWWSGKKKHETGGALIELTHLYLYPLTMFLSCNGFTLQGSNSELSETKRYPLK